MFNNQPAMPPQIKASAQSDRGANADGGHAVRSLLELDGLATAKHSRSSSPAHPAITRIREGLLLPEEDKVPNGDTIEAEYVFIGHEAGMSLSFQLVTRTRLLTTYLVFPRPMISAIQSLLTRTPNNTPYGSPKNEARPANLEGNSGPSLSRSNAIELLEYKLVYNGVNSDMRGHEAHQTIESSQIFKNGFVLIDSRSFDPLEKTAKTTQKKQEYVDPRMVEHFPSTMSHESRKRRHCA